MAEIKTRLLIIGSGPAGYTAAIYASRANLHPLLYEGDQPGGQLTITTEVENFPGYPNGVQGTEMMEEFRQQAIHFGTEIKTGNLGLPDEEKYRGLGVSACATCDGFFYRKKVVAVVGGGDTACEEALYLSTLAKKVYLIVRRGVLRASDVMQQRVKDKENIEILFHCNTLGLFGEDGVEGAHIVKNVGTPEEEKFDIAIDGFFLAIGHKPNTDVFKGQIELDNEGYIKVDGATTHTNVAGVFAAGDCADPRYRQAVVAAGSGCRAALDAEKFLMEHSEV